MLESSNRILGAINGIIVPGLADQMAQESPAQVFPGSQFFNPSSTDLIVISTHTRESQKKAVKSLHLQLAAVITSEHDDLIASMKRGSVLELARETVTLRKSNFLIGLQREKVKALMLVLVGFGWSHRRTLAAETLLMLACALSAVSLVD
ncbi:MAG TPA: hypothetical protein EYM99_00270 [Alphaproteobacteria bacterium]|jgi:hypothetical protein|nr:hypothetical protein [Chromatiaceae bacterium]HIB85544.1 hypothetical protein [Chromatiaceae bacterium]HIN91238.1 hypothetical protein [Alphaproteobacteria bacterium]